MFLIERLFIFKYVKEKGSLSVQAGYKIGHSYHYVLKQSGFLLRIKNLYYNVYINKNI